MERIRLNGLGLLLIALAFLMHLPASAQEWVVPDDKKAEVCPIKFTDEFVKKGEAVFQKNCTSCHGTPSKGNFVKMVPEPGDPATDKFQKQTDGALYYKLTTGRGAMASFKAILTDEERWSAIAYFRSFNKGYVQPDPSIAQSKIRGKNVKVDFVFDEKTSKIKLAVTGELDGKRIPIKGAEVLLYVKRYFGNLPIQTSKPTNETGHVSFDFDPKLKADEQGNMNFIAKVSEPNFGQAEGKASMKIGTPIHPKSLVEKRALWNTGPMIPWWLIISYLAVVGVIWAFLLFIVKEIKRIKEIGDQAMGKSKP